MPMNCFQFDLQVKPKSPEPGTWRRILTFGAEGTEAGNFCRPWGVAITRFSNKNDFKTSLSVAYLIGIADRSNNRIQLFKFDATSQTVTFLHMFGDGPGARHGQFDRPAGIVFNPNLEHIIVADKDNHRVQVFDMTGNFLFKFGERGSKCGQFCYPWDIDVCKTTHNIIVSDTRNRRVQLFNHLGRYITHFSQPLDSPRGVVFLSPTQMMVSDFNKHRLLLIAQSDEKTVSSSTTSSLITSSNIGTNYLKLNDHQSSNLINNNTINNIISNTSKIQQATYDNGRNSLSTAIIQQSHETKFVGFGEGSLWGEFLRPQGATSYGSMVYCADSRNNRIACWNRDNQSFNYIGREVVEVDRPAGLAAIDNYIVIVDFGNNRVHICQRFIPWDCFQFDLQVQSKTQEPETWRRIVTFGAEGTEAGNFCRPWGVAITRFSKNDFKSSLSISYLIGIADRSNNRIQLFKFDATSQTVTFLHMFGDGPGARHGQFDRPAGIVFNPNLEHIIVADKDNHRVQVFDMTGNFLFKFGERGSKCGQFCYPWDIDVCKTTHNIVVSDTRNRRVQLFNHSGRYITHFSQPLDSPRGVVFLSPTQMMVSDFNKHRLLLITQNDEKTVSSSTTSLISSSNIETNYLKLYDHQLHQTSNLINNNTINNIISNTSKIQQVNNNNNINHSNNRNSSSTAIIQQSHETKFVGFGEGSAWGEFLRPQGATSYGSMVYCADSRNNRVACWNRDNQSFNYIGREVVELDRPAGLAAIDNYIVIVDFGNNRVHICQRFIPMNCYPFDMQLQPNF